MWNKIKFYAVFLATMVIGILSALLLREKRKVDGLENDLTKEKVNNEIKANEKELLAARSDADALVDEYERSKRSD